MKVLRESDSSVKNPELKATRILGNLRVAFLHRDVSHQRGLFLCLGMDVCGSSLTRRQAGGIDPPADIPSITAFISTLFEKILSIHDKGYVHGGESSLCCEVVISLC